LHFVPKRHTFACVNKERHPYNTAVAAELRGYLSAADKTQQELADATGLSLQTIGRLLRGERDIDVAVIALMADFLNFEPQELLVRASARLARESRDLAQ